MKSESVEFASVKFAARTSAQLGILKAARDRMIAAKERDEAGAWMERANYEMALELVLPLLFSELERFESAVFVQLAETRGEL
jgi:hypothetical protein